MALQCAITLNYSSATAGQTPPPMATLTVYNPNAVAVAITGVNITSRTLFDGPGKTAMLPSVPPLGPGQPTTLAAGASQNFGPFPVVIGSAGNANSQSGVQQTGNLNPINPQPSQPMQWTLMVGAVVYGSDASVNTAAEAPLLLSYAMPPALGYQGGFAQFAAPNNACMLLPLGVL